MFSPTVRHRCWNVGVDPVKWIPARSTVRQRDPGYRLPVAGDQVDHARRQPGGLEQPHREVRGELLRRRGLPHHDVAEQGRRGRQVAGDRGEVEGGDGQNEAFERPVFHPVPGARGGLRLLFQQPPGVVHVEAPEVDQLAGGVDLRLVHRLGLAADRGGVDRGPPRAAQQVGGLEQDRGPVIERQRAPAGRRRGGGLDGVRHVLVGRVAHGPEHVPEVVRRHDFDGFPGTDALPAADGHGQLGPFPGQLFDLAFHGRPLVASRHVLVNRLVGWLRYVGHGVHERPPWLPGIVDGHSMRTRCGTGRAGAAAFPG